MLKKMNQGRPIPTFNIFSSIAVVIGIVVGTGVFRLPPLVAKHAGNELQFILYWLAGGVISMLGALCYAELAAFNPDAGGEYHFLKQAFGKALGFLFSWGRMLVIQTGSIALIAFILGDYATTLYPLGPYSSSLYATITVVLLTALNLMGTGHSRRTQIIFTTSIVVITIFLILSGLLAGNTGETAKVLSANGSLSLFSGGAAGSAMIFVLLTYGGWNEAAYLSGELINVKRNFIKVLITGISLITILYLLVNIAYLNVLGLEGLQGSKAVGADMVRHIFGETGSLIVSVVIIFSALSTANATIITGARTNYALGRDFKPLSWLGQWNTAGNNPANALMLQGVISLLLIGLGTYSKEAVSTMVDYTAPVFWFFILLTTASLFVFRHRHKKHILPYKLPLYPLTPVLFLLVCLYMLYSSLMFTGTGAFIGVAFLLSGIPVYWVIKRKKTND